MFGLENNTDNQPPEDILYGLEDELKDPIREREIRDGLMEQVGRLKALLRAGEEEEVFDQLGVILHGYLAAKKVMERVKKRKKK